MRLSPVVVNCDPGIDDALALLAPAELARRAEIRVELITTVRGNASAGRGSAVEFTGFDNRSLGRCSACCLQC